MNLKEKLTNNQNKTPSTQPIEFEDYEGVEYKLLLDEPNGVDKEQGLKYRFNFIDLYTLIFLAITTVEYCVTFGLYCFCLAILISLLRSYIIYKLDVVRNMSRKYCPNLWLRAIIFAQQLILFLHLWVWVAVMSTQVNYSGAVLVTIAIEVVPVEIVIIKLINRSSSASPIEPSDCHSKTEMPPTVLSAMVVGRKKYPPTTLEIVSAWLMLMAMHLIGLDQ